MDRKRFSWLGGAGLVLGLVSVSVGGDLLTPSVVVEEKIVLERVLESKGQRALDAILGPGKSQITVVADVNPSATENVEMAPGKGKESAFAWQDPKSGVAILPGFHGRQEGIPVPVTGGHVSRISTVSRFIQKIHATIVADRSVSEEDARGAREALFGVLALDVDRGDTLQLIRGNMPSEVKKGVQWGLSTAYLALLFGIAGLAVVFYAFKAARSLGASVKAAENVMISKTAGPIAAKGEETTTEANPAAPAGDPTPQPPAGEPAPGINAGTGMVATEESTRPTAVFGTLGESTSMAVAAYLEGQTAREAAAVLSVLRPETAGAVLERFGGDFRLNVFKALSGNFNVTDVQKESLAPPLAEYVRTFVHGPHVLVEIYESAPESVQGRLASELAATDPALLAEVQNAVLKAESLWGLPADQWITLATELPAEDLAAALQEAPASERERLAGSLPGELAALVGQHLKLSGTLTPGRTVQARRKLFAAARALRQTGKITLTTTAQG